MLAAQSSQLATSPAPRLKRATWAAPFKHLPPRSDDAGSARRSEPRYRKNTTSPGRTISVTVMSALPPKAAMCVATRDVRFGPIADIATFDVRSCTRLDHSRRKAASKAALHREETERLAVVRHPRILP